MLIHIGFPKTGSTWIQDYMFKGEGTGFWSPWVDEARREFLHPNPYRFSPAQARAVFEPGMDEARRRGLVAVLSDEWLTGNQITADYRGKYVADAMHASFPEARVLIVIREQRAMIMSSYREFVLCGGALTLEQFLGLGLKEEVFHAHCRLDHLEYHLVIEHYQALFGKDRVMVEPFERIFKDTTEFHGRVAAFCGARGNYEAPPPASNVGLRGSALLARRVLNNLDHPFTFQFERAELRRRWISRFTTLAQRAAPAAIDDKLEASLKARLDALVGRTYADSNARTGALIGIDLGAFGYET